MHARFIASAPSHEQLPPSEGLEVAIVGRSNCGKSSLLNALANQKSLARTSSTPGRTQQIVLFEARSGDTVFSIADLPGYGFAKVSKAQKAAWGVSVERYITEREQLRAMLILIDIRRGVQSEELDLIKWCEERQIRAMCVVTKADKIAKNRRFGELEAIKRSGGWKRRPIATSIHDRSSIQSLEKEILRLITSSQ